MNYSYLVLVKEVIVGDLFDTVVDGKVKAFCHKHVLVFMVGLKLHVHVTAFAMPWSIAINVKYRT
jgi:hypothetical protein